MDNKCVDEISTRRSSALKRDGDRSSSTPSHQSALPAKDGGAKRKAGPESHPLRKRPRASEVECSKPVETSVTSRKRKATSDGEGPQKKKGGLEPPEALSSDAKRALFEEKYRQLYPLGKGGCGSVFSGYRRADALPVAIKYITKEKVCMCVDQNGRELSVEVAVMLKLAESANGSGCRSALPAAISLLDWYDLDRELILVLERPVPAEDLFRYLQYNGGHLQEGQAKIIMKQLVDAAIELQDNQIFHRDIKMENILIQTISNVPRAQLIDFGLSCFVEETSSFSTFYGTPCHTPPEWYFQGSYRPGSTTVWQLGIVLYDMLHTGPRFKTKEFLTNKLKVSSNLSPSCQALLKLCLKSFPYLRPKLTDLRRHPWLQ